MDNNYPPFSFTDNAGVQQGILIDQWRLWGQKSGLKVEIHAMEWSKAVAGMKSGEYDVIDTLFKTEERLEWLDFTKPYAKIEVPIFFDKEIGGITDASSLKGFVVGDKRGDAMIQILKQNGVENLLLFESFEAVIQAAKERKVNVFVMGKPPALYFLHKYGIYDRFRQSAPLHVNQFYRAVKKGNSDLLKTVDDGFAAISPEQMKKIDNKWYGTELENSSSMRYLLFSFGGLCLLVLALFVSNRILHRIVSKRTTELKSSEDRYRAIIEQAADGILLGSPEGVITGANNRMEAISGRSKDELVGLHISKLFPPDNLKTMPLRFDLLQQGQTVTSQRELIRPDGSRISVEMASKMMPDGTYQSIYHDITERKIAEEALRENEDLLAQIIELCPISMAIVSMDGTIERINRRAIETFGYFLDDIPVMDRWWELAYPDETYRAEVFAQWMDLVGKAIAAKHEIEPHEYRVTCKDGTIKTTLIFGIPVSDKVFVMFEDITESKKAEEALEESRERFRGLSEAGFEAIFFSEKGVCIEQNKNAEQMFGYSDSEAIGRYGTEWIVPEDRDLVMQNMASGYDERYEVTALRKDGTTFPASIRAKMMHYKGKNIRVTSLNDISVRKKAEEERLNMERQMLHAQKLESLGVLSGGIAHDFNNLLQAILGNLDLALMRLPEHAASRMNIDRAISAGKNAAKLTNMMLAYSGKGLFDIKPLNLTKLVEENASLFEAAISKFITLDRHLDYSLPQVMADAGQLQQVIMNLITNAAEAIGEQGGKIKLSTGVKEFDQASLNRSSLEEKQVAGRYVCMEVRDSGCGMNDETLKKIFDPFFSTKFTGRGLGMSAVLGIIRAHKGAFLVESQPGVGTTIQVLFPIAENQPAESSLIEGELISENKLKRSAKVLVVDDEDMIRAVMTAMLEELGFKTLNAANGEEALTLLQREGDSIGLVMLDQVMPGMDGVTVFKEMRRIRPDIKVLLASGFSQQEVSEHFKGLGLNGFLSKPYTLKNLTAELSRVLEGV
jgi:PAS domain S-box-containing protein